jgi:uncharacterized protein (TIGR00251 family)
MVLFIRIKPNQRFDKVEKKENEWHIRLKAPAMDGKANEHLITFLSEVLELPKSCIAIKKGHTSRMKYLDINAEEEFVLLKLRSAASK